VCLRYRLSFPLFSEEASASFIAGAAGRKGYLMTIYSQHANRGKIQVLATYDGEAGVVSSTVTSVDDGTAATAIVDALNRISASASVPVSIRDERSESYARYPSGHLAAITDPSRRADLLTGKGEHGLWYEYAMLVLHRALADLDTVIAGLPAPVRTAVTAELDAEACGLRVGLHEYEEGPTEEETDRLWDFEDPFVRFDGGMAELSRDMRVGLDRLEASLPDSRLPQAADDLRLLYNAYVAVEEGTLSSFEEEHLSLFYENDGNPADGYFLNVEAPRPGNPHGSSWSITISQWIVTRYDSDGEATSAEGKTVLECIPAERPTAAELDSLLTLAESGPGQVSAWAKTPVGDALAGTVFIVTSRDDDR
jgi:hypothetical protein